MRAMGLKMHHWAQELFPICRSITGPGVRETIQYLTKLLPGLTTHALPSGTAVFDWTIPDEWCIRAAYIENEAGVRVVDFAQHNLHVLNYSEAVDTWLSLDELQQHLYSLPDQPDAIPYVTSYYKRRWGFCLTDRQRQSLPPGQYHVVIDADLKPGVLNYAELVVPGECAEEVFISTYMCHPSMANNELSGPVVTTALAQWIQSLPKRRYTYRFVFVPETIGSIAYLSQKIAHLKRHVVAGFNVTCIGDERCYSFLPSRGGNSLSDRVARHVLTHIDPEYKQYSWLDRGSDERQYCAPGVDLPIATIMRSKYGEYPEYHTSLDDLSLVTPAGLAGGLQALQQAIVLIENNDCYTNTVLCEPQLGKRGLYPTISTKTSGNEVADMMNIISLCDGQHDVLSIAECIGQSYQSVLPVLKKLSQEGLLKKQTVNRQQQLDLAITPAG